MDRETKAAIAQVAADNAKSIADLTTLLVNLNARVSEMMGILQTSTEGRVQIWEQIQGIHETLEKHREVQALLIEAIKEPGY